MADNKKSFLLYCDIIHTIEKLPDEKAGQLFKHILKYVNDLNPETDDLIIQLAFEPIKQSLKRDLQKYLKLVERNRLNGKKPKKAKKATGLSGKPEQARKTDSDSDSVIDSDIEINNIYSLYPSKCFTSGRVTGKCSNNKTKIKSLIKEIGFKELEKRIENYLADCKKSKTYLKNFGTLLNNLPELIEHKPEKLKLSM